MKSAFQAFIEVLNPSTKLYRANWNLESCKKTTCQFNGLKKRKRILIINVSWTNIQLEKWLHECDWFLAISP